MEDLLEPASVKNEGVENESSVSLNSKITEIHPLAFTIQFDDQKYDETKKSKVRERLSAFALKHKRNPSLPDFRDVKNTKISPPVEKIISLKSVSFQHVPVLSKKLEKTSNVLEGQWKSTALKAAKTLELKTSFPFRPSSGAKDNFTQSFKGGRRYSLDGVADVQTACQNQMLTNADNKPVQTSVGNIDDEAENKSDTVSEAGTYTVDKDESPQNDPNATGENYQDVLDFNVIKKAHQSSWIKDWVRDVKKQNMLNPARTEPLTITTREFDNGSCAVSKIPSPLNTLTKKAKPRSSKPGSAVKLNGTIFHKRSSSLGAKDNSGNHGSESSLETESFLRATESVMTSMQNRMKLSLERNLEPKKVERRSFNYKERPHPPSTASDTDTNSENDSKSFKKPIGNPFTSARLNRAFSLRRAKADPEKDHSRTKPLVNDDEGGVTPKPTLSSKGATSKPPASSFSTPFSRLDCGRFSMRSTVSTINKPSPVNQIQKKEVKKSNAGNRSSSSLSSREVEFQNWRRRKSFDPMKAAAEGRRKELARKAAINHSLTQSVTAGSAVRQRSGEGNPVLRSASFHSTAHVLGIEDEVEPFQEHESTDEQDESASSWLSAPRSRPNNSPSQVKPKSRTPICSSRSSLVSETHSSPSRRLKSNDLENLVLSAICDSSFKLKSKSCRLLKNLNYLYEPADEKSSRLKEEIAVLESGQNSAKNSPIHQATSRDLFAVLKNLKGVENVFNVLEDILFDENLQVYLRE